jgi:hypothetical protein
MIGAMNTSEIERPWAAAPQPLRLRWVSTDEGLRMCWQIAEAPKAERLVLLHKDIEPIAA